MGSTKMMCVSHGEALEKTKIRMSIKHQHSLERMRHTVQGLSFPHTQLASGFTSLLISI